jgi:hypothetical protein
MACRGIAVAMLLTVGLYAAIALTCYLALAIETAVFK